MRAVEESEAFLAVVCHKDIDCRRYQTGGVNSLMGSSCTSEEGVHLSTSHATFLCSWDLEIDDSLVGQLTTAKEEQWCK